MGAFGVSEGFVVIYEDQDDFTTATEVADRVLLEQIDWLEDAHLDSQRRWIGEEPPGNRLTWKSIPGRAHEIGIKVHGKFDGEPGQPDAKAARRAIAFVRHLIDDLTAILLIRDADGFGGVFMLAGRDGAPLVIDPQLAARELIISGSLELHQATPVIRVAHWVVSDVP